MEHRNGGRRKITLTVSLEQNGRFLGWFNTVDISSGGLALRGRARNLKSNSLVDITFESSEAGMTPGTTCKALIVHQDNGRLGLMWADQQGVALYRHRQHLSPLLFERSSAPVFPWQYLRQDQPAHSEKPGTEQ